MLPWYTVKVLYYHEPITLQGVRLNIMGCQLTVYHVLLKLIPPRGHHLLDLCLCDFLSMFLGCIVCTQVDGLAESVITAKEMHVVIGRNENQYEEKLCNKAV